MSFGPELQVISSTGRGCGTSGGCSSSGQCEPDSTGTETSTREPVEIEFKNRKLELNAVPTVGTFVHSIDLDVTVECNLRCTYCFKEKWNEHMEEAVAFDTIIWLLHASGPVKEVGVNFMGGEPLIRFQLIKKLVPFGKLRAMQMGKKIHFGMTTNGTLITDEVVQFWKKWGLGFHTSIDGTPEVQDKNRPTTGGRGSSRLVEKSVPKILSYRPNTCARSTVTPETVYSMAESYTYFRKIGYTNIAFVPGGPSCWSEDSIRVFEEQFHQVAELAAQDLREGTLVRLKGLDSYAESLKRGRSPVTCGAGRGLLLVDIHGDIWPCHRWNKDLHDSWRIGSIYEQFNEAKRAVLDVKNQTSHLEQNCSVCIANQMCSGGCPAENLEETGNVYRRHDNSCELTRAIVRVAKKTHEQLVAEGNDLYVTEYCK